LKAIRFSIVTALTIQSLRNAAKVSKVCPKNYWCEPAGKRLLEQANQQYF